MLFYSLICIIKQLYHKIKTDVQNKHWQNYIEIKNILFSATERYSGN